MTNRRDFLKFISLAGITGIIHTNKAFAIDSSPEPFNAYANTIDTDPSRHMRGPFPILSTPYLESGEVDYHTLALEARFVAACGSPGAIWPQADDSCDLLTLEEKLNGMTAIAKALDGIDITFAFGCQGKDTQDMVECAKHVEKIARKYKIRAAVISRPPNNGKTEEDLRNYYLELAKHINRPAIIQTGGGVSYKGPMPPVKMLLELAKLHPNIFGYIKEESGNCNKRIIEENAAKPTIKTVYSAWGSWQWLYQSRQLGTEGLITERPAYADLLTYIWKQMENGDENGTLDDAFARYLLMLNLPQSIPGGGGDMRGPHLYVLKKRGVFKNCISRVFEYRNGKRFIPQNMILEDLKLSATQKDEIEKRLASLKPYTKDIDMKKVSEFKL